MPLLTDFKATATLAWDHALSLLSLYVSRAKEAKKKKKTPDLRLQLRTFLNYKVKVLLNWPSLYTNHEEKYR